MKRVARFATLLVLILSSAARAQKVTSPKEFFGHNIGDDYWLATYDQFVDYWHKIDAESDRMQVFEIGKSAEGRPQLMAIITSPENFRNIARYKQIAQKLAHADGVTESDARAMAKEGKAVVWIDGGLHATEVLGAHQLIETSYQLVTRTDDETQRILKDDIILMVHANPDGMQLVSSWYMREQDPAKRNMQIPRLYQKYIGHDNNRDFYISNQPETQNINHVLYWEWFPQIVYNHHQTGPVGTVMFAPPFRDPFNYNFDPLVPMELDLVGAAMHSRFEAEGKPGVTMRSGSSYSTWWNGGLRTTVYFHNMIGLLTETIGNPTPIKIPLVPANQLPRADLPFPIAPQEWHFRQSIDYSVTANYAVLDIASRYRENLLFNIWRMGTNSIERGSRDSWTITGRDIERLQGSAKEVADAGGAPEAEATPAGGQRASRSGASAGQGVAPRPDRESAVVDAALYDRVLRDPAHRDPRAYVIPSNQTDFATATKFVNTLRHVGIAVQRASAQFTAGGKTYPAGSYVVSSAQAFRPHVLDMFEPQDHPNDVAFPGGPPKRPYDNAGYTLAYQMGVEFDRLMVPVTCTCDTISGLASPMAGMVSNRGAAGFILSPAQNDAFRTVSRLLKSGATVSRLTTALASSGKTYPAGSFYVTGGSAAQTLETASRELGVSAAGVSARPAAAARVRMPRIALWDTYGGSMPSGHTRWLLEQYEYPYEVVYTSTLDAGNLRAKYDVIVLVDGAIPAAGRGFGGFPQQRITPPAEFARMVGRITQDKTVPQLRQFLEQGGDIVTIGSSTQLAYMLDLPVSNALVERSPTGGERVLSAEKFYVPGSILRVAVDSTAPVASGARSHIDVFFDNSPVFRLNPDAAARGVRPIAWFDSETPLRSGWAWGQNYLDGGVAIAEAKVGQGKLYLFGPEIMFRAQPHGTFKFFFNSLLD
ncbi:MAG TPA: M14 metallopeptidase family protein [Gemmatimonadaceae bacterium]|nr:M14 metallopeptidase family protein [Gemmatimonadaceae bacterium]